MYIILSRVFKNEGNIEIGQQLATLFLSPFLKTGLIVAYFNLVRKIPDIIDLLKM